uniref:Uncharacterized protein n=1 Tax=Neobodo designis TaxID=312471 RepID=A0A7S1M0N5_NEODS
MSSEVPDHNDPFRRRMALQFPGCIADLAELLARLEFVQDDIITEIDLSHNTAVESCEGLHRFIQRLAQDDQRNCRSIDLSETGISTDTILALCAALAKCPSITRLKVASLKGPVDWERGLRALCETLSANDSIEELDMSENALGTGVSGLLNVLRGHPKLAVLRLYAVGVPEQAVPMISALQQIKDLDLGGNTCDFSEVRWNELVELRSLSLRHSPFAGSLQGLSSCPSLRSLDLTGSVLDSAGFARMCTVVASSTTLERLCLGGCSGGRIEDALAAVVKNGSITEELDFSSSSCLDVSPVNADGNGLWVDFCRRVLTVGKLKMRDSALSALHVEELVRAFYELEDPTSARVSEVDLRDNPLGDEGADWVAELLSLACVKTLLLGGNCIEDGTPVCEALRARLSTVGSMHTVLCGPSGASQNRFTREQLQWLAKVGVKDANHTAGFNATAAPFLPAAADAFRPFGQP